MPTLYALLVGIDRYRIVASPLGGCVRDITAAEEFLLHRVGSGSDVVVEKLTDAQATREAVIAGFRSCLGRAGRGDTALFWFSGHGSFAEAPDWAWHLEPTGTVQTLVCVDSRHGEVPDLFDKEIAVLVEEVTRGGAHVALVLDCCHAESGTRKAVRAAPQLKRLPPLELLLPQLRERILSGAHQPGPVSHVELAACRSGQQAKERLWGGRLRGAFTVALLSAANQLGPDATYRELLTAARCEVENECAEQVPQLYPADGSLIDQPFLGGRVRPVAANMTMRCVRGEWEIDAGACHGLPTGEPDGTLRVAVRGSHRVKEAEVVEVLTGRSIVRPVGWQPTPTRQYPIVLSSVPLPATTVAFGGEPDDDPDLVARLARALASAGPGGGPSVFLRHAEAGRTAQLRVAAPGPGGIRVLDDTGTDLTGALDDPDGDPVAATMRALSHIARWRQVRSLANPLPALAGAVTLELVPARDGDVLPPLHRPGLRAGDGGLVHLWYRAVNGSWAPPTAYIRMHNNTGRPLHCGLIGLSDRFRVNTELFAATSLAAGATAAAREGRPVKFSLPRDCPVVPGAGARDWLKLFVSEEPFDVAQLALPALGDDTAGSRGPVALQGIFDRLGFRPRFRGGPDSPAACDWTTVTLPIATHVPVLA
jgi:hypothetical protein